MFSLKNGSSTRTPPIAESPFAFINDGILAAKSEPIAGRLLTDKRRCSTGVAPGTKKNEARTACVYAAKGMLVIAPNGEHLGTLNTGEATANCGWGNDGSVLYITADMYLCRIRTKTKGTGF